MPETRCVYRKGIAPLAEFATRRIFARKTAHSAGAKPFCRLRRLLGRLVPLMAELPLLRFLVYLFHLRSEALFAGSKRPDGEVASSKPVRRALHRLEPFFEFQECSIGQLKHMLPRMVDGSDGIVEKG